MKEETKSCEKEAEIKPAEMLGEMELINCTKYNIELPNGKEITPSDSPAFVEDEKEYVGNTMFITREKLNTKNLPEQDSNVLYIVNREVYYNEPKRIDLVCPNGDFNNGTLIVENFEIHPDILREDNESKVYTRYPTCQHCGSWLNYPRWGSRESEYTEGARRVVQLHRKSRSGVNSLITMEIPDLNKEIDFKIQGKELVAIEGEYSSDDDLKINEREM